MSLSKSDFIDEFELMCNHYGCVGKRAVSNEQAEFWYEACVEHDIGIKRFKVLCKALKRKYSGNYMPSVEKFVEAHSKLPCPQTQKDTMYCPKCAGQGLCSVDFEHLDQQALGPDREPYNCHTSSAFACDCENGDKFRRGGLASINTALKDYTKHGWHFDEGRLLDLGGNGVRLFMEKRRWVPPKLPF